MGQVLPSFIRSETPLLVRYFMLLCTSREKRMWSGRLNCASLNRLSMILFILDEEIKAQRGLVTGSETQPVRGRGRIQTLPVCYQGLVS